MKYQYGIKYTYIYPEHLDIAPYENVLEVGDQENVERSFDYVMGNKHTKDVKIVKRKVSEWEDA
jgi:hypothetical protein